jgi:protein-tyrosine phosphatase
MGRVVLVPAARQNALYEWRRRRRGEPPLPPCDIRRVLVICHGNICRSPFAGALLSHRTSAIGVRSAGIDAREGAPAEAGAIRAARAFGIDLDLHTAHRVEADDIEWADLILGMEGHQAAWIEQRWPARWSRTRLLGEYLPMPPYAIEDPWGQSDEIFEATFARIDAAVGRLSQLFEASRR